MVTVWIFSARPQIWKKPAFPPEIQEASATEALTNGTFTGGTEGWTLDETAYDDAEYQAGPGSITTQTVVGKNRAATGTCTHNSVISTNAADTVTLNLYWKKLYVGVGSPVTHTISVQIQTAGGDWSNPTIIWDHTIAGSQDWTQVVDLDVSEYFGTGEYDYRYYMDLQNPNEKDTQTTAWFDETSFDVVSAAAASVTVEDGIVAYGILAPGATMDTLSLIPIDTQHAGNNGDAAADFNIKGYDSVAWSLSTIDAGVNIYMHKFATDGGTIWTALATTDYTTLAKGISVGATQDFDLRIYMPTDTSSWATQDVNVTIQAVLSP